MPSLNDIRSTFLDFFKRNDHRVVDRATRPLPRYFANSRDGSAKALNSSALPHGSRKNMVACSPT